jgi:hypothetical protein
MGTGTQTGRRIIYSDSRDDSTWPSQSSGWDDCTSLAGCESRAAATMRSRLKPDSWGPLPGGETAWQSQISQGALGAAVGAGAVHPAAIIWLGIKLRLPAPLLPGEQELQVNVLLR